MIIVSIRAWEQKIKLNTVENGAEQAKNWVSGSRVMSNDERG